MTVQELIKQLEDCIDPQQEVVCTIAGPEHEMHGYLTHVEIGPDHPVILTFKEA